MAAAAPPHRLIIGLDYGTTYTGIAFLSVRSRDDREETEELWMEWPEVTGPKVPSEISYSGAKNFERQWGYNISENALTLIWTKLELDEGERSEELQLILDALKGMGNLDFEKIRNQNGLPSYPAKEPEDVIADYLSEVCKCVMTNPPGVIDRTFFDTVPIDLVVTVPSIWSEKAKNRTFRAVSKAGFDQRNFKNLHVILVTEAEAAARYTMKTLWDQEGRGSIVLGDCFAICDAGGGTVDLISYRVKQVDPNIQLEEITTGTGARCGATFIDRNFKRWLQRRLGATYFQALAIESPENTIGSHYIVKTQMHKLMKEFETCKRSFDGTAPEKSYMELPPSLNQLHDPERSIIDGELCVTSDDLRELFDPCVEKIIDMIAGQIGLVEDTGFRIRYIFLTGGFGLSNYLFNQVEQFARERRVRVKRPEKDRGDSWVAVQRGAVLKGLDKGRGNLISMRKCRKHYGISVSQPFSAFQHSENDAYIDPFDGERKAGGQMTWLLKKGDALFSDNPKHASVDMCRRFRSEDNKVFESKFVALDDEHAPQRYAELPHGSARMSIISLRYDLSDIAQNEFVRAGGHGQPYLCANFKLHIKLETMMEFWMTFGGRTMGSVEVEYE